MNKKFTISTLFATSFGVCAGLAHMDSVAGESKSIDSPQPTDQFIVRFAPSSASALKLNDADQRGLRLAINSLGHSAKFVRTTSQGHLFKLDRFLTTDQHAAIAAALLLTRSDLASIEADGIGLPIQGTYNDPFWPSQWGMRSTTPGIDPETAWAYSTGAGVVVGIIDTGILPHPDFGGRIYNGYDFMGDAFRANDGDGRDSDAVDPGDWRTAGQCPSPNSGAQNSSWHGTSVAGVVVAVPNNGIGGVGVAPGANALSLRVSGRCGAYWSDVADAIVWGSGGSVAGVGSNPTPARVLNISLAGTQSCPSYLQAAINTARSLGANVVAGAGNDTADAGGTTPANCAGVVAVAGVDENGSRYANSNYGSTVTIAAPATNIPLLTNYGATTSGAYNTIPALLSGTSFAAPHVSGTIALMLSANATLSPNDISLILKGTARAFPGSCSGCGSGIVSAGNAVNAVRAGAAKGTMTTSYATRNSVTSQLALTNSGSGWLTGVTATCAQPGASITSPPPSALAPGQTVLVQASVNWSSYTCGFVFNANQATNSPYQNYSF